MFSLLPLLPALPPPAVPPVPVPPPPLSSSSITGLDEIDGFVEVSHEKKLREHGTETCSLETMRSGSQAINAVWNLTV